MAEAWPEEAWESLERLPRYEIATAPRGKKERIKEAIVRFKGYQNKVLVGKSIAEFDYQPNKCGRSYRLVVVRKNISVRQGEAVLFDEARYFFYITNHIDYGAPEIVAWPMGAARRRPQGLVGSSWTFESMSFRRDALPRVQFHLLQCVSHRGGDVFWWGETPVEPGKDFDPAAGR